MQVKMLWFLSIIKQDIPHTEHWALRNSSKQHYLQWNCWDQYLMIWPSSAADMLLICWAVDSCLASVKIPCSPKRGYSRSLSLCPRDVFDRLHFFQFWSTDGETLKYSNIYYIHFSVRNLPFTGFQYIILELHCCFEKPKVARRKGEGLKILRLRIETLILLLRTLFPQDIFHFHQNTIFQNFSQNI